MGPEIDPGRCKGCGLCVEYCPFGRLALDEGLNQAGYHPVVLNDRPASSGARADPEAEASPTTEAASANAATVIPQLGAGLMRNIAFWCPRCRYCETVCPDAAIRVAGPIDGLEGAPGRVP
jgi:ferredoxin